jgi:hypothetical protein
MIKRKAKRIIKPINIAIKPITQKGFGHEMPPELTAVQIYFDQAGFAHGSDRFFKFYDQAGWRGSRGTLYRNWKVLATCWIAKLQIHNSTIT